MIPIQYRNMTVGDVLDAILSNGVTNFILALIILIPFGLLLQNAPNQFTVILLAAGIGIWSWLVGMAYGRRRVYRDFVQSQRPNPEGR